MTTSTRRLSVSRVCLLACALCFLFLPPALITTLPAQADELTIRHIRPFVNKNLRNHYFIALLKLALDKTAATGGPYKLETAEEIMNQTRAIESLKHGQLDIVWSMTSRQREAQLLPIRIPLLKGLLGYRIFIIREEDKERFHAVATLEQLKNLKAGQGHEWPDTEILRANGVKVITSAKYDNLFRMLQFNRFDYFPRAVNEPWAEVAERKDMHLIVEDSLLIQYPTAQYFFVNRNDTGLAKRIETGLRLAIKDKSFENMFYNHPANKEIFEKAHIEKRKVFKFKNPLMTAETPFDEKELWYNPVQD